MLISISKLRTTIFITIVFSTITNFTTRSLVTAQTCKPSGQITSPQPPKGKCSNNSDCCVAGQNYTTFRCSPPVINHTEAVLNLSGFGQGEAGGGPARCDNKYHSDDTPVVALSTGWFNNASRCGKSIIITSNGGQTAQALVVDECASSTGCNSKSDYQPPCPYNVVAASKAVWQALGVTENSSFYGEMNITWSLTNETHSSKGTDFVQNNRNKIIIVAVLTVVLLGFIIVCLGFHIKNRRRRFSELDDEQWLNSQVLLSDLPKRFTFKELKSSTNNFNEQRKLGSGGFGTVYEGILNDGVGTRVAVKRLDYFKHGKKEFLAEVKTTGCIHHFNLVKLIGFCAEKGHKLLVYEYMSNGSLDKWIFRDDDCNKLNWGTRKKIIVHIAKGLSYLHEDCYSKIIHLDIKPQNILLDHDFNAKLADFGLAKLVDKEESFVATQMRGTRGYLAPEWLTRKITEKVDVYSCGIVVLEVMFGRKNFNVRCQETPTLVEVVREKLEADRLYEVIEECCNGDEELRNNVKEVEKIIKVAIWCLQVDPSRRPSMSTVVKVLEGAIGLEPFIDSSYANSTFQDTYVDISSNATFDLSSLTLTR